MREKLVAQATRVIELFKEWDDNGDGQISRAEFVKAMPQFGLQHCLPIELNALFSSMDPGDDGFISFRELSRLLRESARALEEEKRRRKKGRPESPKVELVDMKSLRGEVKQEVLKMSLKAEFKEMTLATPKSDIEIEIERRLSSERAEEGEGEENDEVDDEDF